MQTELLVSNIEHILSRETLYYLAQYDSIQSAWQTSTDPTWMIQLCDAAKPTRTQKQATLRLGCRMIEQTPIRRNKAARTLIRNRVVTTILHALQQKAEGQSGRWKKVKSSLLPRLKNELPVLRQRYRDDHARLHIIEAVLLLAGREVHLTELYIHIVRSVKAANLVHEYEAYRHANNTIATIIRSVFPTLHRTTTI